LGEGAGDHASNGLPSRDALGSAIHAAATLKDPGLASKWTGMILEACDDGHLRGVVGNPEAMDALIEEARAKHTLWMAAGGAGPQAGARKAPLGSGSAPTGLVQSLFASARGLRGPPAPPAQAVSRDGNFRVRPEVVDLIYEIRSRDRWELEDRPVDSFLDAMMELLLHFEPVPGRDPPEIRWAGERHQYLLLLKRPALGYGSRALCGSLPGAIAPTSGFVHTSGALPAKFVPVGELSRLGLTIHYLSREQGGETVRLFQLKNEQGGVLPARLLVSSPSPWVGFQKQGADAAGSGKVRRVPAPSQPPEDTCDADSGSCPPTWESDSQAESEGGGGHGGGGHARGGPRGDDWGADA
jgi:hypothetical protein